MTLCVHLSVNGGAQCTLTVCVMTPLRQHVLGHTCFLPFLLSFHDEEKRRFSVAHQRMRAEEGCGGRRMIRGSGVATPK